MTDDTAVARLAAFAAAQRDHTEETVQQDAMQRVLDTLGICVPALQTDTGRAVGSLVGAWGGTPESTALGLAARLPAPHAALVNGTLAHALDFDDTHAPSISHPSASSVAAALAVGEQVHASGSTVLAGVAVGNEITLRLGNAAYDPAIGNSVFFDRGLHATSICGALGSAAAAGVVMGLDSARLAHAMGIAASMGAGLLEANRAGGSVKRMHCGWAAHAGVVAAQAAAAGLTGPPTVLEGRFGFFHAYCGDTYEAAALLDDLGTQWQFTDCFVKPYPTNVFTHTGIDAALILRGEGVRPDDIESVQVGVPTPVLRTIAEPREAKIRPESGYHAQFSGPFTFALALMGGGGLGVYLDDFTDSAVRDPRALGLAERITHVSNPDCDRLFPMQFPSIVDVVLRSGEVHHVEVLANRGTSQRPLTTKDVALKFRLNCRSLGSAADVLEQRILTLADRPDCGDLLADLDLTPA
jgi:2-methylcitrate dehydratase PrpD